MGTAESVETLGTVKDSTKGRDCRDGGDSRDGGDRMDSKHGRYNQVWGERGENGQKQVGNRENFHEPARKKRDVWMDMNGKVQTSDKDMCNMC